MKITLRDSVYFINIDFEEIDDNNFGSKNQDLIREGVKNGVIGLKIYKTLRP